MYIEIYVYLWNLNICDFNSLWGVNVSVRGHQTIKWMWVSCPVKTQIKKYTVVDLFMTSVPGGKQTKHNQTSLANIFQCNYTYMIIHVYICLWSAKEKTLKIAQATPLDKTKLNDGNITTWRKTHQYATHTHICIYIYTWSYSYGSSWQHPVVHNKTGLTSSHHI